MSRQARKRRTRHNRGGGARLVGVGLIVAAAVAVLLALAAGAYVLAVASTVRKLAGRRPEVSGASSQVFAAAGARLGFIQSEVLRTPVGYSQMPRQLRQATVAIEDQRFYENDGIDLTGIIRAGIKDLVTGQPLQGASTITMQLVRNLYLGNDLRTPRQKIAEAKLALEYNKAHSKTEVLTQYLNTVPYTTVGGQTALGAQAASRVLFNRPVWQLDLQQCALLAGLPQAPSQYNPLLYPAAARHRRNEVLGKMAELHYISRATARATKAMGLQLQRGYYYSRRRENYFFEYVRQLLLERYGKRVVDRGGLKVYTTIDLHMQELAHKAIAEILNEPGDPSSAIVTINPHDGYIEAMAQSGNYSESQYNLAAEGHRQAGSTFKAIDLAEALSRGVDPNSTYYVSHTLTPGWLTGYPTYEVKTFENTSLNQSISLVSATLASDNTVYAQLAADLGEESITQMAYRMGVKIHLHSYPSEALGGLTLGVSPLEMADVYATLADGGYRNRPIAITKVIFPGGRVDSSWGRPHRTKVLSDGVTSEETKILEENVQAGTAVRSKISCPTAAKTGTTEELVDAWLDGYTPEYSTSVWMGYPNTRVPMLDVHGEPQQGGALPAEIWHAYMEGVVNGHCVSFPSPTEPLIYKPFFGKFATAGQAAQSAAPALGASHAHGKAGAKTKSKPGAGGEPEESPGAATEPHGGAGGGGPRAGQTGAPPGAPRAGPGGGAGAPQGGASAPGH
jgi:penicillin-binding protein 1A